MEMFIVKDTVIPIVLLSDETAAKAFSITPEHAGTCRREMKDIPRWSIQLSDHKRLVDVNVFKAYLDYRGSVEWKKELDAARQKIRKVKR